MPADRRAKGSGPAAGGNWPRQRVQKPAVGSRSAPPFGFEDVSRCRPDRSGGWEGGDGHPFGGGAATGSDDGAEHDYGDHGGDGDGDRGAVRSDERLGGVQVVVDGGWMWHAADTAHLTVVTLRDCQQRKITRCIFKLLVLLKTCREPP